MTSLAYSGGAFAMIDEETVKALDQSIAQLARSNVQRQKAQNELSDLINDLNETNRSKAQAISELSKTVDEVSKQVYTIQLTELAETLDKSVKQLNERLEAFSEDAARFKELTKSDRFKERMKAISEKRKQASHEN